jgi:hypothetical protein
MAKQIKLRCVDFTLVELFKEFEQRGEVIKEIVFQEKDKDMSLDKYSFTGGQASIMPSKSNIRVLETQQETKINDDKVYITRFYTGKSGEELEVVSKRISY